MRWFDGKINSVKNSLIPYVLHGINEEIYDEIVERDDGYYLIVRCGTMPFTNVHNFSDFKTDGNTIIYPLPASEIKEIKLNWTPPTLFGDNSTIVMNSGAVTPEFSGEVQTDRRYKEYRKHISGSNFKIDTTNIDFSRKAYIEEVIGTEEGLGDLLVDDEGSPILDEQGNEQYKIRVVNTGKNRLSFNNVQIQSNSGSLEYTIINANSINLYSGKTEAGWRQINFTVQLEPNTYYSCKAGNVVVNSGEAKITIKKYGNTNYDSTAVDGNRSNDYTAKIQTDNTGLVQIELSATLGTGGLVDITYEQLQLEEGDKATEFEPYKENVATLISPKRLFANEKLSWNSARERYEVIPVFKELEPVKD